MFHKLLNFSEALVDKRVRDVAERNEARVFAKVRLADVLPINGSGITDAQFKFALQSHFDFVVANKEHTPLFAVEFDGPLHDGEQQQQRDKVKDKLCAHFEFPLLRVNSKYLEAKYRGLDLLTWALETWFTVEALAAAQRTGAIPEDEVLLPWMAYSIPGLPNRFPLWLSAEPLVEIRKLREAKKCLDPVPSTVTGVDAQNNYHGIGYLRVAQETFVVVRSAVRSQLFPILESELLEEIVIFEILAALREVLAGSAAPLPRAAASAMVETFRKTYELRSTTTYGAVLGAA